MTTYVPDGAAFSHFALTADVTVHVYVYCE